MFSLQLPNCNFQSTGNEIVIFKKIIGKKIKKVTSDPSAGLDGEMWYNSTTGTLRGLALSTGFASSGNLEPAKYKPAV